MFKRYLDGRLPQQSFFLFGPRQTGKTSLLKEIPALYSLDLLDPALQLEYSKNPNLLRQVLEKLPRSGTVLIDEVQRVPQLLDVIHWLMEKYPKLRFAMSGSSARKLRHGAANLLGGRAVYRSLHPLTEEELEENFRLNWALSFGTLPKIYTELLEGRQEAALDLLKSYVITYLSEEIKAEALVRNLSGFQNFLDIASAQFTQQVNFSDIGRACALSYSTVREYYAILEDTLVGSVLPPYLKSVRKRMSHAPKFYLFDNGVTRAMLGGLSTTASPLETGRLFEQWIFQELIRFEAYHQRDWRFYFWRTGHGAEVDFLIERGGKIRAAIECKYKKSLSRVDLSGLISFQDVFPKVPCFIVAPIRDPLSLDGISALPVLGFIKEIASALEN